MNNHVYHQPETGQSPSMRRSKSFGVESEHRLSYDNKDLFILMSHLKLYIFRPRSRSKRRPPGPIRHPSGYKFQKRI